MRKTAGMHRSGDANIRRSDDSVVRSVLFSWKMLRDNRRWQTTEISKPSYSIFGTTIIYMFTYIAALMCNIYLSTGNEHEEEGAKCSFLDGLFSFFDMNSSGKTRKNYR